MTRNNAEALREAARYIEEKGWRQNALGEPGYAACMLGSISFTSGHRAIAIGAIAHPAGPGEYLDLWMEENVGPVSHIRGLISRPTAYWNDRPETTKEDAVLWMKRAAADAEEAESA